MAGLNFSFVASLVCVCVLRWWCWPSAWGKWTGTSCFGDVVRVVRLFQSVTEGGVRVVGW